MIPGQDVTVESSIQKMPLGTRFFDESTGKTWYYVKANEALAKGAVLTPLVAEADGDCDASSGAKRLTDAVVTFTLAMVGSWVKINAGTIAINDAPNRIVGFEDADNLIMENEWSGTLSTSEDYVVYNPWKVEEADAAGEQIIGVAQFAITSGYYFWMQTGGPADHVLIKGDGNAIVANKGIIASGTSGKGFGHTAVPSGDTYNTVAMELARVETMQSNIIALVPSALAAQTVPAYLRLLP